MRVMASEQIHELDVVALTKDLRAEGLGPGHVGTVVHVYSPDQFEVEFVSQDGRTYALTTVSRDQLLRLQFEPAAA